MTGQIDSERNCGCGKEIARQVAYDSLEEKNEKLKKQVMRLSSLASNMINEMSQGAEDFYMKEVVTPFEEELNEIIEDC